MFKEQPINLTYSSFSYETFEDLLDRDEDKEREISIERALLEQKRLAKVKFNKKFIDTDSINFDHKDDDYDKHHTISLLRRHSLDLDLLENKGVRSLTLKPTKSVLLKQTRIRSTKKKKHSVIFNSVQDIIEVENWKKYNTDVSRVQFPNTQRRSLFCSIF